MFHRWLFTHTSFPGEPATALQRLETSTRGLLQAALGLQDGEPASDGTFTLATPIVESDDVVLDATVGPGTREGSRVRVPLGWAAAGDDRGPAFGGALEMERVGPATLELSLYGQYTAAGDAGDPQALLAISEVVGRRVLRAVAAELSEGGRTSVRRRTARMRVRDLMTADTFVLREDTPLRTAALVLLHRRIGGAPVVDATGYPVGVLTETDLLVREAAPRERRGAAAREESRRRQATVAGEACSRPALTVHPETSVREAARLLYDEDVSRLVVVEGGRIAGIITRHDVLRALTRSPQELETAVEAALDEAGIRGVRAEVSDGERVVLEGRTEWRTTAEEAVRVVAAVDGVAGVHDRLEWATDDVPRSPRGWALAEQGGTGR